MYLLGSAVKRSFRLALYCHRPTSEASSSLVLFAKRFGSSEPPPTGSPSSGTPSSNRKTSSFAADTSFAESNRKATGGGIPKNLNSPQQTKQSSYFTNRTAATRLRHRFLRNWYTAIAWVRRYSFHLLFGAAIVVHFIFYHVKYRWKYGPDYPITYFDWMMRKHTGTLDPELTKRSEQADRYWRLRFEENIKD